MARFLDALMALGCFVLISALWLTALGVFATVLIQSFYGFSPLSLAAWKTLYLSFQHGGTVPLGFLLYGLATILLAGMGETAILWRLPAIAAAMPAPHLPRLALPRLVVPTRRRRSAPARTEPVTAPSMAPPPSPPQTPAAAPRQESKATDSAILSRILALFDVWNEPPPAWMAEALRDEVVLLSPEAWPTLESLGNQGLDLLLTLREHGMLPESPAALRAIGEVETILRTGVVDALDAAGKNSLSSRPPLTLAASWLCEALDNFLAAQADPAVPAERLFMAQSMFDRALRGMADADWASLDLYPEKAGRIRVLSDRLREDMRTTATRAAAPPANPAEAIIALLKQFGFTVDGPGPDFDREPLLARREDLQLLLQIVDLKGTDWRLPKGLLGPWLSDPAQPETFPARQLWQQLARRRLRQAGLKPLIGLLVAHDGRIEQEDRLAEMIAADRRRSSIGLAWLTEERGAIHSLEQELAQLSDRIGRDRRHDHSPDHSTFSP